MATVNIYIFFLSIGAVGIVLLLFFSFRAKNSVRDKHEEKDLCDLFYKQHAFLFHHKKHFYDFEKVKELLFFEKNRLFQNEITHTTWKSYFLLGERDLAYIQQLIENEK